MRALLWTVLLAAHAAPAAEEVPAMGKWTTATPAEVGMDAAKLEQARDYALTGGGAGCILRRGRLVMSWGDPKKRYDLKSTTKSIGFTAVGLALADGKITSLDEKVTAYHPTFATTKPISDGPEWARQITLRHLATHTAGCDKPGGYSKLLFEPGTKFAYSDSGPNWLAECVTLRYKRDLKELLFERVFAAIGITRRDLTWRNNMYRPHKIDGVPNREFGAGIHANVDAMARIGLLYLREGRWGGKQLLSREFVRLARTVPAENRGLPVVYRPKRMAGASSRYALLWWTNADGKLSSVPRDAYWSWGLYESFIIVIPSLDLVVARAGRSWKETRHSYDKLAPFLAPVVAACTKTGDSPRRPSPVITKLTWAPASTIVRKAAGSDNWPLTWADDDALYATYGDGWGFEPKVKGKLSLGFAKVLGAPPEFKGVNIRSKTGERKGDGRGGEKASGLLCVDGVLYAAVRNANRKGQQSVIAHSTDHAKTWTWSNWRFAEFGHPCFVNFGKDYAGARDEFVYLLSPDTPDAYKETDRVALARVPKDRILQRDAWEFFVRRTDDGDAEWTTDIGRRGAALELPGGCNRMDVVYNAPLKRYLMTMRARGVDGGKDHFSIFDAPQPWGPWTTVFTTGKWDVDPGEVQRIPSKWIAADGRSFHLVFAGNDSFSVRKATLTIAKGSKP